MADNKTERATPRRRQKVREQGKIARSRELSSAVAVLAVICFLYGSNPGWVPQWHDLMERLLNAATNTDIQASSSIVSWTGVVALKWLAPSCLIAFGTVLVLQFAQGGFVFTTAALTPNFARMNPAENIKNLVSPVGLSRMLKTLIPLSIIVYLGFIIIVAQWPSIIRASMAGVSALPGMLSARAFEVAWKGAFVLLLWSVVDYALQRRKFETDLKMSKQELRDEGKESEGNPVVKGHLRRLQRQMRKRRMLKDVQKATVVVTNPTHFAIALRYEMETMDAPVVIAKGRDLLAQKIKQIAQWHNIPMVENRPLAQTLYRAVDVGSIIPSKLYTAVAEILAFVYRAQAETARRNGGKR